MKRRELREPLVIYKMTYLSMLAVYPPMFLLIENPLNILLKLETLFVMKKCKKCKHFELFQFFG